MVMEFTDLAIILGFAGLAGAALYLLVALHHAHRAHAEALNRASDAQRSYLDAAAELERSDAVVARLWLRFDPDLAGVYGQAIAAFGKPTVDLEIRKSIERGEYKLPEARN